jgi:ribosomal protein S18 acetylase RimI-like enzyme
MDPDFHRDDGPRISSDISTMKIRPYEASDLDVVVKIWFESWKSIGIKQAGSITREHLRERLPQEIAGGWSVHVAIAGGDIAGFVAFQADHLQQLFIAPAFQGRGIGKSLLNFAKQQMPAGFRLATAVENTRACRFYEREGLMRGEISTHKRLGHPIVRYDWTPNL